MQSCPVDDIAANAAYLQSSRVAFAMDEELWIRPVTWLILRPGNPFDMFFSQDKKRRL
jgi:hypothetical protein